MDSAVINTHCKNSIVTAPNEVRGKVICLQVSVCPRGGVWSQGGFGPGGVPGLGGV